MSGSERNTVYDALRQIDAAVEQARKHLDNLQGARALLAGSIAEMEQRQGIRRKRGRPRKAVTVEPPREGE